jgi:hypothetical protein
MVMISLAELGAGRAVGISAANYPFRVGLVGYVRPYRTPPFLIIAPQGSMTRLALDFAPKTASRVLLILAPGFTRL